MSVLFTACEIGSARALLPVCTMCEARGLPFSVLARGDMAKIVSETWHCIENFPKEVGDLVHLLEEQKIELVVFSVNVKDSYPLKVARAAEKLGLPTIHVLDYWNGYLSRMKLDNCPPFNPTVYVVPDEYARRKALQEGIALSAIRVLGQPALADTIRHYEHLDRARISSELDKQGIDRSKKLLVFVSEPVANDQGESLKDNPDYRGYTEKDTLKILVDAVQGVKEEVQVCVLPHPREDIQALKQYWKKIHGEDLGRIVSLEWGRDLLPFAFAVTGMSSTLLYEAWILGIPVASIQPGLRNESLSMFGEREGIFFIPEKKGAMVKLAEWIEERKYKQTKLPYRIEASLHRNSVEELYRLILGFITHDQHEARVLQE